MMDDRFLEIPEAARLLTIHPETARRWIREGRFPVPVRTVGGKQVVSSRRLSAYIDADNDVDAADLMQEAS